MAEQRARVRLIGVRCISMVDEAVVIVPVLCPHKRCPVRSQRVVERNWFYYEDSLQFAPASSAETAQGGGVRNWLVPDGRRR